MLQRFNLGTAAKAICLPNLETAQSGSKADSRQPTQFAEPAIQLPADHYAHRGAPTEWWWNIGTLQAGGRTFGFEASAASYAGQGGFAFTQIMLSDVRNNRHFQRTTTYLEGVFNCEDWAEYDPTKNWFVALGSPSNCLSAIYITSPGTGYTSAPAVAITGGGGLNASATATLNASGGVASIDLWNAGDGYTSEPTVTLTGGGGHGATAKAFHSYVTMNAAAGDPTQNMAVKARLVDEVTQAVVTFDLTLSQQGPPFLVLGSGLIPVKKSGPPLQRNNYYYSLTRLQATGSISIEGETLQVTGVTWMDHEYGVFAAAGKPVKWILQNMQLDNGVSIANFTLEEPELNKETLSIATLQYPDQPTFWALSTTTPRKLWISPMTGKSYFLELQVEMRRSLLPWWPDLIPWWPDASLTVTSLIDSQEFPVAAGPVYEGVARASGVFNGQEVSGHAWNEQAPP